MGYKIVAVNPLKQFPIASLKLTNVASFDAVRKLLFEKFSKERWHKIGSALDLHLARQTRRQAHFETTCRLEGCDNPRRGKRGSGGERATKSHRPGVRPFFCGAHVWLRRSLTQDALDALHAKSANRVRLV